MAVKRCGLKNHGAPETQSADWMEKTPGLAVRWTTFFSTGKNPDTRQDTNRSHYWNVALTWSPFPPLVKNASWIQCFKAVFGRNWYIFYRGMSSSKSTKFLTFGMIHIGYGRLENCRVRLHVNGETVVLPRNVTLQPPARLPSSNPVQVKNMPCTLPAAKNTFR